MSDQDEFVTVIRGGVVDDEVYLRANDVIADLRATAAMFERQVANAVDEDEADYLTACAHAFDADADEYELVAIQIATEHEFEGDSDEDE